MSVIWKCFDGIQREEISISDVRNEFRFLLWKVSFQCQFDCKLFARYPWSKKEIINAISSSSFSRN